MMHHSDNGLNRESGQEVCKGLLHCDDSNNCNSYRELSEVSGKEGATNCREDTEGGAAVIMFSTES